MYHRTKKTKLQPSNTLSWPHKRLILKIWTVHFMISFIMSFSPSTNNFVWVVWFRIASSCTSMVLRNLSSCLYSASFHISHPCFTPESSATTSPGSRWACFLFLLARVLPLLSSLTRGLSAVRNGSFTPFYQLSPAKMPPWSKWYSLLWSGRASIWLYFWFNLVTQVSFICRFQLSRWSLKQINPMPWSEDFIQSVKKFEGSHNFLSAFFSSTVHSCPDLTIFVLQVGDSFFKLFHGLLLDLWYILLPAGNFKLIRNLFPYFSLLRGGYTFNFCIFCAPDFQ